VEGSLLGKRHVGKVFSGVARLNGSDILLAEVVAVSSGASSRRPLPDGWSTHRNMGQVLGGGGAVWLSGYSGEMDKTDPGRNQNHEINSS
jgi:hypothetical protein